MNTQNEQQLAEALVQIGALSEMELEQAQDIQKQNGLNLVQALLTSGMVSAHDIAQATETMSAAEEPIDVSEPSSSEQAFEATSEPVEAEEEKKGPRKKRARPKRDSLESYEVDPAALQDVPRSVAEQYMLLPLQVSEDRILVAMADATDVFAMDEVRGLTGRRVEPVEIDSDELEGAIEQYYSTQARRKVKVADTRDLEANVSEAAAESLDDSLSEMLDTAPVVRIVQEVLREAVRQRASDIHIEPRGEYMNVRYRIDGQLQTATQLPMDMHRYVLSRIKILAGEDIAETRKPQDGRFATVVDERPIDLRVSTLPTYWGEKAVLRILDKSNALVSLTQLGFREDTLKDFDRLIKMQQGLLLVTGPTGSGKTTTLYASLHKLNDETRNITTVEDPIEYEVEGLNQVAVNRPVDLTFATALRFILRQDPDIILVGEIRDLETAEMTFRASLTGHLCLSTLHTNDAPSAATRLVDIGIPPYITGSSLIGVLAQRLVRKLCKRCREQVEPTEQELERLQLSNEQASKIKFHRARGCHSCRNTGYSGRTALYELMIVSNDIREAIVSGANASELRKIAVNAGMKTLKYDGLAKINAGITSANEVAGVMFIGDELG